MGIQRQQEMERQQMEMQRLEQEKQQQQQSTTQFSTTSITQMSDYETEAQKRKEYEQWFKAQEKEAMEYSASVKYEVNEVTSKQEITKVEKFNTVQQSLVQGNRHQEIQWQDDQLKQQEILRQQELQRQNEILKQQELQKEYEMQRLLDLQR